jgi:hypothetical protein
LGLFTIVLTQRAKLLSICVQGLQLAPLFPLWWLPGLAFTIVLTCYEELRKAIARKHVGSFVDTETQF